MLMTAQRQEKTSQMTNTSREHLGNGGFFALFALFTRFINDRMTRSRLRMGILGASGCFSTWLGRSSRGTQLSQKGWHSPTNLCQGDHRAAMLPGAVHAFDQRTSQHQLIMYTGHHLGPAFGLLWGAKARLIPKQHLLVQPEAMLVGVAQAIGRADLAQGRGFVAFPHKPTDLGVARIALGPMADDLDHAHLDLTGLAQMQLGPAPHFDTPAFGIGALPRAIRLPMATLVAALEARPIQRTATTLAWLTRRSGTIKDAIAFDAQQTTGTDLCHPSQKRGTGVPAIPDADGDK